MAKPFDSDALAQELDSQLDAEDYLAEYPKDRGCDR
jgi:hypothetical protein